MAPSAELPASRLTGPPTTWTRGLRLGAWSRILVATPILFLASWLAQPQSVSHSSLLGMLPFAAILAIAAVGQTLVIQQGGIDLSVPGVMSMTIVLVTHYPNGDSSKLGVALAMAFAVAMAAGLVTGLIVSGAGVMPIVTTLGMNALLYGGVLQISGGTPRQTTAQLHSFASSSLGGVPTTVLVAIAATAVVSFIVKRTVAGRRFEAVGANAAAARAAGLQVARCQVGAYVAAAALYCSAAVLLAGVVTTPSVFQGDGYLLPTVAAVVLGGTSLLGGAGSTVATALGALFLTQLQQLVLTTGVNSAVQYLIEAVAIVGGIAVYRVRGGRLPGWASTARRRPSRSEEKVPDKSTPTGGGDTSQR